MSDVNADLTRQSHERRDLIYGAVALMVVAAFSCLLEIAIAIPNHDNAWFLEISHRMREGGKYQSEFFELNPPLYPIILMPIHYLSEMTGIVLYDTFIIYICVMVYIMSFAIFNLLGRIFTGFNLVERLLFAALIEVVLIFWPGYDFGQREHIAIIMFLPTLFLLAASRDVQLLTPFAIALLVLGACGLLIKPHLLAAMFAIVGLRAAILRSPSTFIGAPAWIVSLACGGYAILIITVYPEWIEMARTAAQFYYAYDKPYILNRDVRY